MSSSAEPTESAVAPLDAASVQAGGKWFKVATAAELFHHATKSLEEFVYPTSIRSEYRVIFNKLSQSRPACMLLVIVLIFSVAEYEQPGWFPRPDQLNSAIVCTSVMLLMGLFNTAHSLKEQIGFLGASALLFPAFTLFEYAETHSWPWEDEGFVWPWEALLWSSTVYNDEPFDESTTAFTHLQDVPKSPSLQARQDMVASDHGRTSNVASGGIKSGLTTETSGKQDMVIPPTPFLPRGLRPAYLPSPSKYCSVLLGESPMPDKVEYTNGKLVLEYSEPEDKRAV